MPETSQTEKGLDTLSELLTQYVEATRDTQVAAQKQYGLACRNYVDALRDSLKETPYQEAARAYVEAVQASWTTQDQAQHLEASRQYATATREAHIFLQRRFQEAYKGFVDEVQRAWTEAGEAQKTGFETFLKSLQDAFGRTDTKRLDVATLARMGQATLAAAYLRAHLG